MKQLIANRSLLILHRPHYPLTHRSDEISNILYEDEKYFNFKVCVTFEHDLIKMKIRSSSSENKLNLKLPKLSRFNKLNLSFFITLFSFFIFIISFKKIFRYFKFNLCWSGDLLLASLSPFLKLFSICEKFVYDDPDYYPVCYSGIKKIIVSFLEIIVIKSSDLIISISDILVKIRKSQGVKAVKTIPHMVNYDLFKMVYENRLKRFAQENFKPRIILYVGNYSDELKNDLLLNSLDLVSKSGVDFIFILVGSGDIHILNKFMLNANKLGFGDKILYLGPVSREKLLLIYEKADIAIGKLTPKYLYYGTTKKLLEYMAAGLPVIVSDLGLPHILVKKSNCGFISQINAQSLSLVILKALKLSREEIMIISKNARTLAERHDSKILGEHYCKILKNSI